MSEEKWPSDAVKDLLKDEQEDPAKEIKQKYRHVFLNSEMGRSVLKDILINLCHYGEYQEFSHKAIAENNVAVGILIRCGIYDTAENISKSLNSLFNG